MHEIENERRNGRLLHAQQKLRDEAKIAGKRGKKRIEMVQKTQNEMRQKFIESSDFIRECNAKATQAAQQIDNETRIQNKLERETDEYEANIGRLTEFHGRFGSAIVDIQPYEQVLDDVVSRMDLFKTKEDLLNRCDALRTPIFIQISFILSLIEKIKLCNSTFVVYSACAKRSNAQR